MGNGSRAGGLFLVALACLHAKASEPAAARTIYRCESGHATVFSDRPCDTSAEVYEPESLLNRYEPAKAAPRAQAGTHGRRRVKPSPDRQAAARDQWAESCRRIQTSLREIRSKMRAGYTAREGERLRERQNRLQAQRRAAKCR